MKYSLQVPSPRVRAVGIRLEYAFEAERRHDELTPLLTGFNGVLQADAYGAYANH